MRRTIGWVGAVLVVGCGNGVGETPEQTLAYEASRVTAPPPPTQLGEFALLATGRVLLQDRTVVAGGHVGIAPGTGDSLTAGVDARVGLGRSTLGQRVVLKDRAGVGDLFADTVVGAVGTYSSLSPYSAPPTPPPIVPFTAGTLAKTINTPTTLGAGNYGSVTVNSTLTLSGGIFQIQNLTLSNDAVVQTNSATILRVAGRVTGGHRIRLTPTGSLGADTFRMVVAGATDTTGGVLLGADAQVKALIVSKSSFQAGDRLAGSGAISARNITLGFDSSYTFATGFECASDSACNDNNPCTVDSCVDARCVHPAVTNGTACPDDGNVCTSDACSSGICAHPALANGVTCTSDNNECTTDRCTSGACTHPAVSDGTTCLDDGNECTSDVCTSGSCGHPALADGVECTDDGNACTIDLCASGACVHPGPTTCASSPLELGDFSIVASGPIVIGPNAIVEGSIGTTSGGNASTPYSVVIHENARVAQAGYILGQSVQLASGVQVGGIMAGEVIRNPGAPFVYQLPFASPPSGPSFDNLASVPADAPDVAVEGGHSLEIAAGSYGTVVVGAGATMALSGGIYQFRSISVGDAGKIVGKGPVAFTLDDSLTVGEVGQILSESGKPGDMVGAVRPRPPSSSPHPIRIGAGTELVATLGGDDVDFEIGDHVSIVGGLKGGRVNLGAGTRVVPEPGKSGG
jgi:hypothetical protein